ncbi:ATP-binding protein [Marinobacterium jannaschii]|uniref:ATP-binding protein n=1 Tax=Marinobacterium jannaschii TaxID=64970 RepID=UPI0005661499|nr:sensor histidine kinase [Marinobacterium jannaschii]
MALLTLRHLKLKPRMILILGLVALLQTGLIGLFAVNYLSRAMDEQIAQRALHVATTIAAQPQIASAVLARNSDFLRPLSLTLARRTEARYVVIGDRDGVRLAHPSADAIGYSMLDDESDEVELYFPDGRGYTYTAHGSLGLSMRARAPIYAPDGPELIGVVSVGYLKDSIEQVIDRYRLTLIAVIVVAFIFSVMIAIWLANHFKKAISGLEPEQIGRLYGERNATLESVREGIIAINQRGEITTFNRAAVETLGLDNDSGLIGRPVQEVLPDSRMLDVLESGQPQFDQEVWLHDRNLIVNRLPLLQDGRISGVVSSFRRKDELDQVSRKLTRIQQYADTLRSQSHEYSNKLHTIAGLIQIGASDQALALIGQETQSHQALIQLLVDAIPDPVLAGCLLGKYNRAREMGLQLQIDEESHMTELPDRLPREQLVSILGNLIDNALEATLQHRGPGGEIRMSMTDLGNDLIFEIEDDGPGIAADQQQRIFEKGVTSKEDDGHGIGLHLVKAQLNQLGGSITLEPGDQGGSRFTVYIPKA